MGSKNTTGYMYKGFWIEHYEKAFDVTGKGKDKTSTLTLWRVLAGRAGGPVAEKNLGSEDDARSKVDERSQASGQ